MKIIIASVALLALTACGDKKINSASAEPVVVPVEVAVAVDSPCVPDTYSDVEPDYVDSTEKLKAAADAAERYQLLWGGRAQRIARDREKTVVIAGCPRGRSVR